MATKTIVKMKTGTYKGRIGKIVKALYAYRSGDKDKFLIKIGTKLIYANETDFSVIKRGSI